MIRRIVDFALDNPLLIAALGILLFIWGVISFRNLPIEAYPDVANNYVQIITQWPGRAAEEVEQQVTIPIEIVMNGLPHLEHLRSTSVFGLSSLMLVFDDDSENDWNRQKVLERLSSVNLPENLQPQIGTDYSPVGQIFWYTLKSTNPEYDLMELKSLEDWVLEKQFKSVPNVVDVSSFGGITKEYQVQIDPEKLVSYGLSLATGRAATGEQQHQRRWQLHRSRTAAGERAVHRAVRSCGRYRPNRAEDAERNADPHLGYRARDARAENPAGPHRQGDPSRRRQNHRRRRRD